MSTGREFRARSLAILTLGLIFGAGFGIGLAVERNLVAGTLGGEEPAPEMLAEASEDEARRDDDDDDDRGLIVHRVGLTAEQRALIDEEARIYFERVRELAGEKREVDREFNERSRRLIQDGRAAIMEHLTEEQKLEYERLLEEFDQRRRERRDRDRNDDRDDRDQNDDRTP